MRVVDCTPDHIADFLSRPIRPEDIAEWIAASGQHPEALLPAAFTDGGPHIRALLHGDGRCLAVWGLNGAAGTVWLIASEEVVHHAWKVNYRVGRKELALMAAQSHTLDAFSHADNLVHHRWLEWLGFRVVMKGFAGPKDDLFLHYRWSQSEHV